MTNCLNNEFDVQCKSHSINVKAMSTILEILNTRINEFKDQSKVINKLLVLRIKVTIVLPFEWVLLVGNTLLAFISSSLFEVICLSAFSPGSPNAENNLSLFCFSLSYAAVLDFKISAIDFYLARTQAWLILTVKKLDHWSRSIEIGRKL